MAAWRYKISLLVLKKYFTRSLHSLVKYFSTLEEKFRIHARPCNILYIINTLLRKNKDLVLPLWKGNGQFKLFHTALTRENSRHFVMPPLVSPQNVVWKNECRNSILMTCHYPDLGSASGWLKQISHIAWPIRSTTQIWVGHVISMEFLHLFLRQHFARKLMVMLCNFRCFLMVCCNQFTS